MASLGTAYIKIAPDMSGVQGTISRGLGGAGAGAGSDAGKQFGSAFQKFANDPIVNFGNKILKGTLVAGSVAAAGLIVSNIGNAVKRIDTLVAFPRVLQAMGVSADDAARATQTLGDRLTGLPTPLQEGASSVQALVAAGLGINEATETFLSFNNATLAASTDAGRAQGAFEQLTKAISTGKIEADGWQSLVSAMPTAFQALQTETGKSTQELLELYRTNPQGLLDDLNRLGTEGGGGMASLETQAREATGGIATGFANMNTAVTKGIQAIVEAFGNGDLAAGQKAISDGITAVGSAFQTALEKVGEFVTFVIENKDVFAPIAVAVGTFVGAIAGLAAIIKVVTIVQGIWNTVLMANPIALIVIAIAALVAGLIYFFTQTELGQLIFENAMNAIKVAIGAVVSFFQSAWEAIKSVWGTVKGFFQGVWDGIVAVFSAVTSWFGSVFRGAWDAIKAIWSAVTGWFGNVWNGIKIIFNAVVGFYSGIFSGAWNAIKGIWSAVTGWFSGVWNGIKGIFSGVGGWFRSTFQAGWNSITSIFGKIRGWFGDRLNDIKSVFSPSALKDSGKALIQGLIDGIKAMLGKVKETAKSAVQAIKNFFPSSPAKEGPFSGKGYTSFSGEALIGDFAQGISDNASKARQAAMQAMSGVQGAMSADYNIGVNGASSYAPAGANKSPAIINLHVGSKQIASQIIDDINDMSFLNGRSVINI